MREVQPAELGRAVLEDQPAAHGVLDRLRLLEDLLQHEVREAAALDLGEVPVDAVDLPRQRRGVEIDHAVAVAVDHRHVAVVEVHDLPACARGSRDASDARKFSPFPTPSSSGLPLRAATILSGFPARHHGDAVRALDLAQRLDHGLFQRAVVQLLDEVRDHLGVRVGPERMAVFLQRAAEHGRVLDDAVVHDGDATVVAQVRMRVALGGRAVRRPPRVTDPEHPIHRVGGEHRLELRDLSRRRAGSGGPCRRAARRPRSRSRGTPCASAPRGAAAWPASVRRIR